MPAVVTDNKGVIEEANLVFKKNLILIEYQKEIN